MVLVGRMTFRSILKCEVCGEDRIDGKDQAYMLDYLDNIQKYIQESPTGIIWVYLGTSMLGVVSCTRAKCIAATIEACQTTAQLMAMAPLERWLNLHEPVAWWRQSKQWIQHGNFIVSPIGDNAGKLTTFEDMLCPVQFAMNTSGPITPGLKGEEHAVRKVHLRDILKATPELRKAVVLELARDGAVNVPGYALMQQEVAASAPPTLEFLREQLGLAVTAVKAFSHTTIDGIDAYGIQIDNQDDTREELGSKPHNTNIVLVQRDNGAVYF
jgi:hypothetical protein